MFKWWLVLALATAVVFAGTAAAYTYTYASNVYFFPGNARDSAYDSCQEQTVQNQMVKTSDSYGLIAFIDNNGYHWHGTSQGFGNLYISDSNFYIKKAHCEDNGSTAYFASCSRNTSITGICF